MKKMKRLMAGVLALAFVLAGLPGTVKDVKAWSKWSGDWEYEMNEDESSVTITDFRGSDSEIVIPSKIDGKSVTRINSEVIPMSIFEYDEKRHMETVRNEGITQGIAQGLEQEKTETAKRLIKLGKYSMEEISVVTELPIDKIREIADLSSAII